MIGGHNLGEDDDTELLVSWLEGRLMEMTRGKSEDEVIRLPDIWGLRFMWLVLLLLLSEESLLF